MEIDNYYKPDVIWEIYGASSQKEYIDKFMVKGRFHPAVPNDVREAFTTVEYLIAHSYYHYPMFDEALKKALGIFEMAVKLRCNELNIPVTLPSKRGVIPDRRLVDLITELHIVEPIKEMSDSLNNLRLIRNIYSHPSYYSFIGVIARLNILSIVNTLNALFKDPLVIAQYNKDFNRYKKLYHSFEKGLFILVDNELRILISCAKPKLIAFEGETLIGFWQLDPILENVLINFPEYAFDPPIKLVLENVILSNGTINAKEYTTKRAIMIKPTSNPINVGKLQSFYNDIYSLEEQVRIVYNMHCETSALPDIAKFIYDFGA